MQKLSFGAIAREHLERAGTSPAARSAETVYGGLPHGPVRLHSGQDVWEAISGDLLAVPQQRHSLDALEDAAVVLTVVKAS